MVLLRALHPFAVGTGIYLPFPDRTFDAVVMSELIEHIAQPELMLSEVARILTPEGALMLTTPSRLQEDFPPEHYHEFFPAELETLLQGFFAQVRVKQFCPAWLLELYAPLQPSWMRRLVKYLINGLVQPSVSSIRVCCPSQDQFDGVK